MAYQTSTKTTYTNASALSLAKKQVVSYCINCAFLFNELETSSLTVHTRYTYTSQSNSKVGACRWGIQHSLKTYTIIIYTI